MRRWRPLLLITFAVFTLGPTVRASAADGCDASSDTAAVNQYCESLPTADGNTDVTQRHARPLALALPPKIVRMLRRAGPLGAAVLALPAGVAQRTAGLSGRERTAVKTAGRGLLPGPGVNARAVISTLGTGGELDAGFKWALAITLISLSGFSVWRSAFRSYEG
jgi:hypothetical protein